MKNVLLAGLAALAWMSAAAADHSIAESSLRRLPFSFERGIEGKWVAHGINGRVEVGPAGAAITTGSTEIQMNFLDACGNAESTPEIPLPGKFNYLIGADPKQWIRDVQTFGRVRYHNVYEGVDVAWHGVEGGIEYDLMLAPGADASRVALRFNGALTVAVEPGGDLRVETAAGPLTMHVPVVYQEASGARRRVEAHYKLRAGNEVSFELARYDKSRALVIDPTLVYAAWFNSQNIHVTSMVRDPQGNLYAGGWGAWMPAVNAFQPDLGYTGPFIIKFDPTGQTVQYATFIGSGAISGIAVDSNGNVVATGTGGAPGFDSVTASCADNYSGYCGFVFRLSAAGDSLISASPILGGRGAAVAVDSAGNAYVAGSVQQSGFDGFETTQGAYWTTAGTPYGDAFVEKYAIDGSVLYATLLGANGGANAITVDGQGFAYVAGYTSGGGFVGVPGARSITGGSGAFVAKLGADGKTLPWAAILGGSGTDTANALARDGASGILYIAGQTTSADLATTAGVIQPASHGNTDGFVGSVSADGSAFGFVTYLGGLSDDQIYAMALTPGGQIVVAGDTASPDFPVSGAVQPAMGGGGFPLFATSDYGSHWTAEGAGLASAVSILSVDPTNPAIIVAATSGGLFRTVNGGVSWSEVDTPGGGFFGVPPPPSNYIDLSRSIADPSVLYALRDDSSVSKSTDSGATWSVPAVYSIPDGAPIIYIVASPNDENKFLAIGWDAKIYGGNTPLRKAFSALTIFPSASPDGSIYVGMNEGPSGPPGIGRSTDDGATWTFLTGSPSDLSIYSAPVSVCTSNPAVLYAGDYTNLDKSTDTGATWTALGLGVYAFWFSVAPSNCQVVYAIASGLGLQLSTDGGATWSSASGDLTTAVPTTLAVDPTNPAHAWIAAMVNTDGFVAKISIDGTKLLWSTFYGGSNSEDVRGLVVDGAGNAWIAGTTNSTDVPLTTGIQPPANQSVLMLGEISDATAACAYTLIPPSAISYGAGIVTFAVTAPSGCSWTATPSDSWISAVNPASGMASASMGAVLAANNTDAARTGTITVASGTFTINEASSSCQYSLDQNAFSLPSSGGQVTVNITAGTGCPWSVVPRGLAVVSGASGTGNGQVKLSAPANTGMRSISFVAMVGPQPVTVTVADSCIYSLSPLTFDGSLTSLIINVTATSSACSWSPSLNATWLTIDTGSQQGSGTLTAATSTNRTGAPRTANITIESQVFTLTQTEDTLPQYTLTVVASPPGAGTVGPNVTADAGTIECPTETPNPGWLFNAWTGVTFGALGDSNCLFLNSNLTATAQFVSTSALLFRPVQPCRAVDTRNAAGPLGGPSIAGGTSRDFAIAGNACNIALNAAAVSLNAAIVPTSHGYMTMWPTGQPQPATASVNSPDGLVHSNGAIVPVGTGGAISVYAYDTMDVVLDVNGYFYSATPAEAPLDTLFHPLTPCRAVDTRNADGDLGGPYLSGGSTRSFVLFEAAGACNITIPPVAYSLNIAVVPRNGVFHYLTAWPADDPQPQVATLNDPQGINHSNAAIVATGVQGGISVYVTDDTDVVIDINGYFTLAEDGGLSYYTLQPCRALDTRNPAGSPPFTGTLAVDVVASGCGAPSTAEAYVFNATAVPQSSHGYLTLWQQNTAQPAAVNLNDPNGATTGNMAIVPTNNGFINAYFPGTTHLVLDLFGYFAP